MKYPLSILLFIPFFAMAQNTDTTDHPYFGEYFNMVYKASTHQAYDIAGTIVPHLSTGQPAYVAEIFGGPHDCACIGPVAPGNLYMMGSVFSTAEGVFTNVTVDSAGNALPGVTQVYCTSTNTSPDWVDVIVTTDSTTGRQVGMAGQLSGGMHGNGVNSTANQTSFVWATFPIPVHIIKVCGLFGVKALDSKGRVWTWGYANNKAQLSRGTTPTVSYLLPDTIVLPPGRHAIDIADNGSAGVIVLDDHEVLGTGSNPSLWGGSSQGSSNTPQNFTTFLTTSAGVDPVTGQSFVPAKVFAGSTAIYYIGVDSTLVASGDNICGQIGNGQMYPMNTYTFAPAPTGGTPAPYAYDNGLGPSGKGEFPQYTPVRICVGAHNWECGYMGPSNCWNANFVNNKHEIWVWGRGKAGQLMNDRATCNWLSGGLNSQYPDAVNMPYPLKITPFTITSGNAITPTCFYCIANPGATNCSQGTSCYNGSLASPVVNGSKQILTSVTTSATITPSVTYASGSKEYLNIVTFMSGPNTPIMPFNTGTTISLSGLTSGTYILKDSATDIEWNTGVSFDTIVVGESIGPIPVGSKIHVAFDNIPLFDPKYYAANKNKKQYFYRSLQKQESWIR